MVNKYQKIIKIFIVSGWILLIYFLYHFFTNINFISLWKFVITGRWYLLPIPLACGILMVSAQGLLIKKIFGFYKIKASTTEVISLWLQLVSAGVVSSGVLSPLILLQRIRKSKGDIAEASKILSIFYIYYFTPIIAFILIVFFTAGIPNILPINSVFKKSLIDFLILFCIIIIFIIFRNNKYLANFWQTFKELRSGAKLSQKMGALLISVGEQIFNLGILIFLLLAFNVHIELISAIKILAIIELIAIIAPSGGGVGFVDFGLVLAFRLVNISHQEALMLTLIYRLINLWIPTIIGGFLLIVNYRELLSIRTTLNKKT